MDIYKIILNDPIYTTIAIILTVVVFISIFKKLFKVAIILIGFFHSAASNAWVAIQPSR